MSIRRTFRHVAVAAMVAAAGTTAAAQTGQAPAPQAAGQGLPISMQEAVAMALDFNLGLKSERMNPAIADYGVALARSTFLPQVQGSLTQQSSRNVPSDFTQGTSDITNDGLNVGGSVAQQLRWTGATYSVNWNGNRSTQDGGISSFNPRLGSNLRINVAQPLLRGFKTDNARTALVTSVRNREIADVQLQQRVVGLEASVRLAYLSLVGAIEGKKVAEQNMDIAEQSLRQAKARVQVGQSPQIDIIQSEAQVASNRVSLLQAEVQISTAEDSLRSLIMDPARPDYWTVHLSPTDQIRLTPRDVDADAAIKNALANRLDLISQKRAMEITDLNLKVSQNSTLPAVDLNLNYSAQGTSGTQFTFGSGFPPPGRQHRDALVQRRARRHVRQRVSVLVARRDRGVSVRTDGGRSHLRAVTGSPAPAGTGAAAARVRNRPPGPRRRAPVAEQLPARAGYAGLPHRRRAAARSRTPPLRGRHVDDAGTANPRARPRQRARHRTGRDDRLQPGADSARPRAEDPVGETGELAN
jgi:outer membrane protein TolC